MILVARFSAAALSLLVVWMQVDSTAAWSSSSPQPSSSVPISTTTTTRRRMLLETPSVAAAVAATAFGWWFPPTGNSVAHAASTEATTAAPLSPDVFVGSYTDPINHPGGTRTIELTGTGLGGFQLAKVTGGGGKGEPKSFQLNAMISPCPGRRAVADLCITIDFTPKGGPPDFGGYWDGKGIRFPADGNFWPKTD